MAAVHTALRLRQYSQATERVYCDWIRRLIQTCGRRHPADLGAEDLRAFINALVEQRQVGASTHNQALCAIAFLYRVVLKIEPPWLEGVIPPKPKQDLPVVLTRNEVSRVLARLEGVPKLMAALLYGSGLRVFECVRLRIKDLDFDRGHIVVRQEKGKRDRNTLFPTSLRDPMQRHLARVRTMHEQDLAAGAGFVELPHPLSIKHPNAPKEWSWQWVFPATRQYRDKETGELRRHHLSETVLQRAVRQAVLASGIAKPASCRSLRHSFATQLLEAGYDLQTIQALLGHRNSSATMDHAQIVGVRSPLD